jgi:argininosuccinate lyase
VTVIAATAATAIDTATAAAKPGAGRTAATNDATTATVKARGNCTAAATTPGSAADSALLATDIADYLVRKGMPFRQAHHVVGALVGNAEKAGKKLHELTLDEFRSVDQHFSSDVLQLFDLKQAMAHRNIVGSPGPTEVRRQIARWTKLLG